MQKVFQLIYEDSKAQNTLEDAVRTAIQHPEQQEEYSSALRSGGFALCRDALREAFPVFSLSLISY